MERADSLTQRKKERKKGGISKKIALAIAVVIGGAIGGAIVAPPSCSGTRQEILRAIDGF